MSIYSEDLAYIHHHGFGDFAKKAAPAIVRTIKSAGISAGLIVDLGCGSGILARAMTKAGFDVLGIDTSFSLLRLAKKIAPGARFLKTSLRTVKVPECDAVTAIGEPLNYISGNASAHSFASIFLRVSNALPPGGVFIFDLMLQHGLKQPHRAWKEGPDWAVLVEASASNKNRLIRRITSFRKIGSHYRRSHERHYLVLPQRSNIVEELKAAGFAVRVSRSYGNLRLGPHRYAFFARKR